MSQPTATRTVVVASPQGLHLRQASLLVEAAGPFQSKIEIVKDGERFDAKSILALMSLGANQGTQLRLEATGDDAQQAVDALAASIETECAAEETDNTDQTDRQSVCREE
jgi:phosphocarrier protein HPr